MRHTSLPLKRNTNQQRSHNRLSQTPQLTFSRISYHQIIRSPHTQSISHTHNNLTPIRRSLGTHLTLRQPFPRQLRIIIKASQQRINHNQHNRHHTIHRNPHRRTTTIRPLRRTIIRNLRINSINNNMVTLTVTRKSPRPIQTLFTLLSLSTRRLNRRPLMTSPHTRTNRNDNSLNIRRTHSQHSNSQHRHSRILTNTIRRLSQHQHTRGNTSQLRQNRHRQISRISNTTNNTLRRNRPQPMNTRTRRLNIRTSTPNNNRLLTTHNRHNQIISPTVRNQGNSSTSQTSQQGHTSPNSNTSQLHTYHPHTQ